MTYSSDSFWDDYAKYALATADKHKELASRCLKAPNSRFENLVDIGCGKTQLARSFFQNRYEKYIGIDAVNFGQQIVANYEEFDFKTLNLSDAPQLAVSLYSTECCLSLDKQKIFYERLFDSGFSVAILAGFYYTGRESEVLIEEAHGLQSYQTLPDKPYLDNEIRIMSPVPSTLFGANVVEVWRVIHK